MPTQHEAAHISLDHVFLWRGPLYIIPLMSEKSTQGRATARKQPRFELLELPWALSRARHGGSRHDENWMVVKEDEEKGQGTEGTSGEKAKPVRREKRRSWKTAFCCHRFPVYTFNT